MPIKPKGKVVSNPDFGQKVGNLGAGFFNYNYNSPEEWASIANSQQWWAEQPSQLPSYNERGLPEAWDWKTAALGPNNEPLPERAKGWTPNGRPDFGADLSGVWDNFVWKLFTSERIVRPTAENLKQNFESNFQAQQQKALAATKPGEVASATGGVLGSVLGTVLQAIGNAWSGLEELGGNEFNALNAFPRLVGAAMDTAIYGFDAWDRTRKENLFIPRLLQAEEVLTEEGLVPEATMQSWKKWLGPIALFPMWLRAGAAAISNKIEWDDLEVSAQNELASRLGYTAFKDSAAKELFLQKVRAGYDPRLLAMELQSPLYEMAFDIITDPFTYIGIGAIKRALGIGSEISKVRNARRFVQPVVDLMQEINKLDGAPKLSKMNELWRLMDTKVADVLTEQVGEAGRRGTFHRLATAKQAEVINDATDTIGHLLAATHGDPDEALRITKAMTMMIDPDDAVKAKGLELFNESIRGYGDISLANVFGPEGISTAELFQEIFGRDGKRVVELIKKADGDVAKLNDLFAEDLGKIVRRRFPNVQTQLKQNEGLAELITKHGEKSPEVTTFLKANPIANIPVAEIHRRLAPIYETMNKYFYKPVGAFQGTVFMGMNPAYRVRNRMGNFAAIWVDQGPAAAGKALLTPFGKKRSLKELNELLGRTKATAIAAEERGIGAAGAFDEGSWIKGKINYFARTAAEDEKIGGVHAMLPAIRRVVRSVLHKDRALQGISDILTDPKDVDLFVKLARRYRGDLRAAFAAFADAKGVDVGRTLSFLDDRQLAHLDDLHLTDRIRNIVEDADLDAAGIKRAIDDVIDEWVDDGDRAAREAVIHTNQEIAEIAQPIGEELGDEGAVLSDLFERQLNEGQMWTDAADQELTQALNKLRQDLANKLYDHAKATGRDTRNASNIANSIADKIKDGAGEVIYADLQRTRNKWRSMRERYWRWSNEANEMALETRVRLYERLHLGPVIAPENLTVGVFKSALWNSYRRRARNQWHNYRKFHVFESQRSIDELYQIVHPGEVGIDNGLRNATNRLGVSADILQRSKIGDDGLAYVNIYAHELDDLVVGHYGKALAAAQNVEPREMYRAAEVIRNNIDGWRDEIAQGRRTVDDIITEVTADTADPNIQKALVGVAGTRARVPDMMRSLLSEEPNLRRRLDYLTAQRDLLGGLHPSKQAIESQIQFANIRIDELGDPVRAIDEATFGTEVVTKTGDKGIVMGRASPTTAGKARLKVEITSEDGTRRVSTLVTDGLSISESELRRADEVDKLRDHLATLENARKTRPDDVPQQVQDTLSYYDGEIKRITRQVQAVEETPKGILDSVRAKYDEIFAGTPEATKLNTFISELESRDPGAVLRVMGDTDLDRAVSEVAQELGIPAKEVERLLFEEVLGPGPAVPKPVVAFRRPVVGHMDDATPTRARFMYEARPAAKKILEEVKRGIDENWGNVERKVLSPEQERQFAEALPQWERHVADARFVAEKVGSAARDFALHNYGNKYGFDLLLGLVFPYQFWYSRSYVKWMQRLAMNPGVTGAYLRYRKAMETMHAGLPEWWKYQINTNELLGIDSEHPFYINLETLVNPLYGLTGVDFTDPKRRVDGWGAMMEDIQKLGPSVWAPYQWALAMHYNNIGEEDAASRWAGRLLPFSRPLRDLTALVDPKGHGVEIDPAVNWFGGGNIFGNLFGGKPGIEPYERGRIGRQLGMMISEGQYPIENIIDASYNQSGDIWDIAWGRAINDRAPNFAAAVAPFLMGAAGKLRNPKDIQIDQMYNQMYSLRANKPNMSPEEYKQQWSNLRENYPFFDTVLLSKRSGLDRDEALAWNVLSRIPPGMTDEVAEKLGVDETLFSKFYEMKGDLREFGDADRLQFMGAILEAGSLMALPNNATRREWDLAREQYRAMIELGKERFGEDIWDLTDIYFAQRDPENPDAGRQFLQANPIIEQALDFRQLTIQNTPMLAVYYTSAERIEMFYKQQMYDQAEILLGSDLWNKFEVYGRLKDMGENKAARQYWKDNPELRAYMDFKDEQLPLIDNHVEEFVRLIPEPKGPFYRDEELKLIEDVPEFNSYNTDARESWVNNQVLSYAQAHSDFAGQRQDIRDFVRAQADARWPGTRSGADRYYRTVDENPEQATELLSKNAELEARVRWEFERILRLSLAREQEFVAAAAETSGAISQFGGAQEQSFEQILSQLQPDLTTPLGRLLNDPEGIPPHLLEAYGIGQ